MAMLRKLLTLIFLLGVTHVGYSQIENEDSVMVVPVQNVEIFKDPRLDELDKRPALLAKAIVEAEKEKAKEKEKEIPLYKPITSADGKKKVTGSIYSAKGFRIVIFNGADRNQAIAAKNSFMRAFPSTPTYLTYNVPSYKIKVGNFESRNEASSFLRKVSKAFPTAFIVPDLVTIKNINVTQ